MKGKRVENLTVKSPDGCVESKHDDNDNVGHQIDQHLEPKELVDFLENFPMNDSLNWKFACSKVTWPTV